MDGAPGIITEKLSTVPSDLVSGSEGKAVIGVAGGVVWRLDVRSKVWTNLVVTDGQRIGGIAWPMSGWFRNAQRDYVIVSGDRAADLWQLNILSGAMSRLLRPSEHARLVAVSDSGMAVFVADEPSGSYLTIIDKGTCRTIVATNQFFERVTTGEARTID